MTVLTEGARKIAARAAGQARAYAAGQDRPLGGYAVTMVTYATVAGALAGLARLTGRPVPSGWRGPTSRFSGRPPTSSAGCWPRTR